MIFSILNMSSDSNKGDLAILESTVFLIKKYFPVSKVVVFTVEFSEEEVNKDDGFLYTKELPIDNLFGSFFPRIYKGKNKFFETIKALSYFFSAFWLLTLIGLFRKKSLKIIPRKSKDAVEQLLESDLVIVKGGSYFFSYGGLKQLIFVFRMLLPCFIAILLHKKIIALGHSIGPLRGEIARWMTRACLKGFNKIVVREDISHDFLIKELHFNEEFVTLLPDLAFWTPPVNYNVPVQLERYLEKENIVLKQPFDMKVGVTVRNWHFPLQGNKNELFAKYRQTMASVLETLLVEYNAAIFFMPHALDDLKISELIAGKIKGINVFVLKNDYSTYELRKLYGCMDIFIGTRIHSDIFALGEGVPTIALAYEIPKGFGIIRMLGGDEVILNVANLNRDGFLEKINKVIKNHTEIKQYLMHRTNDLETTISNNFEKILKNSLKNCCP